MLTRRRLLLSGIAAFAAGPALAQADRVARSVVRQLERQGFTVLEVRETFLGRVRIMARRGDLSRELVIDPRNGTILRDFVDRGSGGSNIPDIGDYDDDVDDDDDDDDDDDGDDSDDDGDDGDDDGDDGGGDDDGDDD